MPRLPTLVLAILLVSFTVAAAGRADPAPPPPLNARAETLSESASALDGRASTLEDRGDRVGERGKLPERRVHGIDYRAEDVEALYGHVEVTTQAHGQVVALAIDVHPADGFFDFVFQLDLPEPIEPLAQLYPNAYMRIWNDALAFWPLEDRETVALVLHGSTSLSPLPRKTLSGISLVRHAVSSEDPFGGPLPLLPETEECQAGGQGAPRCTVGGHNGRCEASCAAGFYACCVTGEPLRCGCLATVGLGAGR